MGVKLMSEEDIMRTNPGGKQARYQKPQVTKANKTLKDLRK